MSISASVPSAASLVLVKKYCSLSSPIASVLTTELPLHAACRVGCQFVCCAHLLSDVRKKHQQWHSEG